MQASTVTSAEAPASQQSPAEEAELDDNFRPLPKFIVVTVVETSEDSSEQQSPPYPETPIDPEGVADFI
tara:strand:- start:103 stop:309 length:207 start_codon:yes stop_codon:yes gene_type:complete